MWFFIGFYIIDRLSHMDRNDLVPDRLKMLCAKIIRHLSKSLLVCTWYAPLNSDMSLFNEYNVSL